MDLVDRKGFRSFQIFLQLVDLKHVVDFIDRKGLRSFQIFLQFADLKHVLDFIDQKRFRPFQIFLQFVDLKYVLDSFELIVIEKNFFDRKFDFLIFRSFISNSVTHSAIYVLSDPKAFHFFGSATPSQSLTGFLCC